MHSSLSAERRLAEGWSSTPVPVLLLLALFAAALCVRLAYVLLFPQMPVESDAGDYLRLAMRLAEGRGYVSDVNAITPIERPEVFWAPGHPFFLSVIFTLAGHDLTAARVAQALVGALVV